MKSYTDAMRRYFDFSSRMTRSQFWQFAAVTCGWVVLAIIIDALLGTGANGDIAGIVTALVIIVHLVPGFAAEVRRLHDIDRSGWSVFVHLVPIAGPIIMLVFLCTASSRGANRFGAAMGRRNDLLTAGGAPMGASEP
jgi:uncharacterized membrane protein YhaH (DUF805 family)